MKCPNCGKTRKLIDGFCKDCHLERNPLLLGFKVFTVGKCINCDVYEFEGTDLKVKSLDGALVKVFKKVLKKNKNVTIEDVSVKFKVPKHEEGHKVKIKASAEFLIKGTIDGLKTTEQCETDFKLHYILCNKCSIKNSGYFEGILQLRNGNKEVENFIVNETETAKTAFITKVEHVKGGLDFYLTDNGYLKTLAKRVMNAYGGDMKTTAKIFTRDRLTMKDVYRVNVLIRLFDFKLKDYVSYSGKVLKIVKVGKDNVGKDIKTGKSVVIKDPSVVEALSSFKTTVVRVRPSVEVLHPETYQNVKVENSVDGLVDGKEVRVFVLNDKIYLKN
jgi:NMD protein affecting ribosome stability and mRNA decay